MTPDPDTGASIVKSLIGYGFSGSIAAFLLWWATSVIGASVTDTQSMVKDHVKEMAVLMEIMREIKDSQEESEYLQRQICYGVNRNSPAQCNSRAIGRSQP